MPTFLDSHFKIQKLESRLNKNQYLSNQCLPNFVDAQVLKALKTSEKIPKRQIYPNFYHWYILMRQFADRSLQMWIKDHEIEHLNDQTILDVVEVIKDNIGEKLKNTRQSSLQISVFEKTQKQNLTIFLKSPGQKQSVRDSVIQSPPNYLQLPKVSSHIEKKSKNQYDAVTEYIIDIKLSSQRYKGYENVQKLFEIQTVKLESIRLINGPQDLQAGCDIRVLFLTVSHVCEDLKNQILRCSNVQNIQCKKHKRNQSL